MFKYVQLLINQQMRTLKEIAKEIRSTWKNIYFGAVPYVEAMETLNSINDDYFFDSGREIVVRFLANASTWRGNDARRIKAELKAML